MRIHGLLQAQSEFNVSSGSTYRQWQSMCAVEYRQAEWSGQSTYVREFTYRQFVAGEFTYRQFVAES